MSYFIESGYVSLNKKGEELCGDRVEIIRNENDTTIVLADGLGSGVKANILATLTSKILCNLAANNVPIEECVKTIIGTLPVCKVRNVAYATFTLLHMDNDGKGSLVEFDNPQAILLRDGKCLDLNRVENTILGKTIYITNLQLIPGDVVIFTSDGVVHAGIGQFLNFGWQREEIKKYIEANFEDGMSPICIAALVGDACKTLYADEPGDDTTIAALKIKKEVVVDMMVGAPIDKNDDDEVVEAFLRDNSTKIVCGGTTSQIVARYLNTDVKTNLDFIDPEVPPTGMIRGIDLTTEGVITLRKLLELAKKYMDNMDVSPKSFHKKDGASRLADILFEQATHINFFVGRSINKAHEGLPIDTAMKLKIIERLADKMERLGKVVTVNYY